MKYLFAFFALMLVAFGASAQQNSNTNSAADSSSQSGAASQSGSSLSFTSESIRQAPGIGIGSIGTSFASDYCMGAFNTGISIPGGSLGFGKSLNDPNCSKRRNIERLNQMAMAYMAAGDPTTAANLRKASINVMCSMDIETYNAMSLAGVHCQMLPGGKPVDPNYRTLAEYRAQQGQ